MGLLGNLIQPPQLQAHRVGGHFVRTLGARRLDRNGLVQRFRSTRTGSPCPTTSACSFGKSAFHFATRAPCSSAVMGLGPGMGCWASGAHRASAQAAAIHPSLTIHPFRSYVTRPVSLSDAVTPTRLKPGTAKSSASRGPRGGRGMPGRHLLVSANISRGWNRG